MKSLKNIVAAALLATASLVGTSAVALAEYPEKPITLIVPHAAGGPTDTVSRLIAESMQKTLGQTIVVENVGGAGSTVGTARAARAEADGYTLLLNHVAMASMVTLYRKLDFHSDKNFDGIGRITDVPMSIIAKANYAANDIAGLIEAVKANGDKTLYGHAGVGSASHLCGMLFMDALKTKMTTVSYKGTGPAMKDLLGGVFDMMCDQTTNTVPQIAGGKVKGYAVTTPQRLDVLKDLPTLQEAGLKDFNMTVWHGLFTPAGTPDDVKTKLSGALQAALADPAVVEAFAKLGTSPVAAEAATPASMDAYLAAQIDLWKPIIEASGTHAD